MAGLAIGFTTPWLLAALIVLPVLWVILRAIPPAPVRRQFPGVALLLGLGDEDTVTDRTPWWLLVLRMLALAGVIIGLAGPVLNPREVVSGSGPLLVVLDGGWASAANWGAQEKMLEAELDEAARQGRDVAILRLTTPEPLKFEPAALWKSRLAGLEPLPWLPNSTQFNDARGALGAGGFDTLWLSDGLAYDGRATLLAELERRGGVRVFESGRGALGLLPARFQDGKLLLTAIRAKSVVARDVRVLAKGRDPAGNERVLASGVFSFAAGAESAETALSLPAELRARISRFELAGIETAGAVVLSDDSLRRREVALIAAGADREGLQLLSPTHYLRQALQPTAEVLEGALDIILPANPDVIVLADVAALSEVEERGLLEWVEAGGLLLRFAGPRLAASEIARREEHPLMPVRLRAGGRNVGGAMSWGEPKEIAPFAPESPFFGLTVPAEVTVTAQVVAQPDPTLAERVIAELTDGTPMVTRKSLGAGQVVLFHVTANAEWSGLPLSGLFVQMLDRLAVLGGGGARSQEQLRGTVWQPLKVLDGFGHLQDGQTFTGVAGEALVTPEVGPALLPGLYQQRDRIIAVNALGDQTRLAPIIWPARVTVEGLSADPARDLAGAFLAGALIILALDVLASLAVSGRLWGAVVVLALVLGVPHGADAQSSTADSRDVVLAYVLTGNAQVDRTSAAGLKGLSDTLRYRTSVEPAPPVGVDLERDELAFYPFIYWPITPDQPRPTDEAYARLNTYLRSGGMIVFDTRDADVAGFGASSPNGRKLQQLALPLDIPPLDLLPEDHVLTRTFYLLQDFPGRYANGEVWVEAAPVDAERVEGMPFRNLNDGVTPVVIGGNDWAAAWAVDASGYTMFPVGRGRAGERQREISYRFGVNLIMHVLTGNYKSDQVHVPALLDRLGQ